MSTKITPREKAAYRKLSKAAAELLAAREEARRQQGRQNENHQDRPDGQADPGDN